MKRTALGLALVLFSWPLCPSQTRGDPIQSGLHNQEYHPHNGTSVAVDIISFTIVFIGDQVAGLGPPDPARFVNAFAPQHGGSESISYDSKTNQTTLVFTGPQPITIKPGGTVGLHVGFPIDEGSASPSKPVIENQHIGKAFATLSNKTTLSVPTENSHISAFNSSSPPAYVVRYNALTNTLGQTSDSWSEFVVPTGSPYTYSIDNPGTDDLTISDAKFFVSPDLIPLDLLNTENFGPTDPRWTDDLNLPNGTAIPPGQTFSTPSETANPVPEPSTLALFGIGVLSLLSCRRRRKLARA